MCLREFTNYIYANNDISTNFRINKLLIFFKMMGKEEKLTKPNEEQEMTSLAKLLFLD